MGVFGGSEDFVLVVLQGADPRAYVRRMLLRVVWDSALRCQEHRREFGPKFLFGVVRIAESIAFVERWAIQSGRVPGPVAQLMKSRPVVIRCATERFFRRQVNCVLGAAVERAVLLIVRNCRAGVLEDFFTGFGNFPVL